MMRAWRGTLRAVPLGLLTAGLLVLMCGYSIYSIWLAVQPFAGKTVDLAGRQRLLLQRISGDTLILVRETSVEPRSEILHSMLRTYAQFQRVERGFESGDASLGLSGNNTPGAARVLARMKLNVALLGIIIETISESSPRDLLRLSEDSPEVRGILGAADSLAGDYDDFLREYIGGAEREIVRHKALEIAVFIAAFSLILYVQFVARGLGRQLRRVGHRLSGKSRLLEKEILARQASEEGRRLLFAAFEQANESIVITDAGGKVRYVNAAFVRNTGYLKGEILGKTQSMLKSGEQDAEFYRRMWSTIGSGQPWRGPIVNRRKDGTLRDESLAIYPIRDARGRITHYAGFKSDITREVEMERLLQKSQRLEAIGVLASGVAHDFNNILTPIIGYTDLTMGLVPEHSEAHDNLLIVRSAAERAKDTVTLIRNAVRQNTHPPQSVQLEAIAKEVLALLRSTAAKSIAIAENIPPRLPAVLADPSNVHRLLMNLCVNACQAMLEGGQLAIALEAVQLQSTAGYLGSPAPGDFIRIEVRDTGRGMSEETMARIFEPYFTTRQGSSGTGLGLFVVFNIVKQFKGGIRVDSRENAGTTFEVILPVTQSHRDPANEAGRTEAPGHERVLFIDDEEMVGKLAKSALERLGYSVTAASDPVAACGLFEQDPSRFDVVFTDRTMPGMGGEEVLKRIKAIRPELPVILCSGLSDTHGENSVKALGFDACIQKPFALGELSTAIEKVTRAAAVPA